MRNKKFALLPCIGSLIGAFWGMILSTLFFPVHYGADPFVRALSVGLYFTVLFIFGFVGMELGLKLDKKYRVQRPRGWGAALALTCVLLFGIGFGGQYLYMYSKEEVVKTTEVDMVLALDASGSMKNYGYELARNEAASQFVDSLPDDTRLQIVSFAATVVDSTNLVPMDAANKSAHKDTIKGINSVGGTDFNEPMTLAKETLDNQARSGAAKVVILLTDGEGDLDTNVISKYKSGDILFFPVRIWPNVSLSKYTQPLVDLATATGGFDTLLIPKADGTVDTSAMLNAFQNAFKATSERKVAMRPGTILANGNDALTGFQYLVRAVVIILCAILVGYGYFGRFSLPTFVAHGVLGLVAAGLTFLIDKKLNHFPLSGFGLTGFVIVLTMYLAFAFYDLQGEAQTNV